MENTTPKHTPGPWKMVTCGTGQSDSMKRHPVTGEPFQETDKVACQKFGYMKMVCHVYQGESKPRDFSAELEEQAANAALIAAAPDLLAALEAAIPKVESHEAYFEEPKDYRILPMLRAALAKAKGETT